MKRSVFSLVFCLTIFFSLCLAALDEIAAAAIPDRLIRLHVLAASDAETDQRRKLAVRDAVLALLDPALASCANREEAIACVHEILPDVEAAALDTLRSLGSEEAVTVTLSEETYPVRVYDTFALPAGKYESLRIDIGAGEGHNWWCVVFPPLCLAAAEETPEADEAWAVFSPAETRLVTCEGRRIRLRALDLWQKLHALLK